MTESHVILEGWQVRLRDWLTEDLSAYREWLKPHHEWNLWNGPYFPPHMSKRRMPPLSASRGSWNQASGPRCDGDW